MPERHDDKAIRSSKLAQARHTALSFGSIEVHPHRRQVNSVISFAASNNPVQTRQLIVEPFDFRACMKALAVAAKLDRGLDGDNRVAEGRQCCGVASGSGADIEDARWPVGAGGGAFAGGFGQR